MDDKASSQAATAETVARVHDSFARQGLMRLLEASITHVSPGRVQISLPSRAEISQQHGYVHAGATGAITGDARRLVAAGQQTLITVSTKSPS